MSARREFLLAALGLAGVYAFIQSASAKIVPTSGGSTSLDDIYAKYGNLYNVEPGLLKAVAQVESSENPSAVNPSDPSYGLMQIVCTGASGDQYCKNNFNINGWEQATPNKLLDADFNVSLAAQILGWNINNYGRLQGIAVYNNWSARLDPVYGPFRNQSYVDKVSAAYTRITGGAL